MQRVGRGCIAEFDLLLNSWPLMRDQDLLTALLSKVVNFLLVMNTWSC